MASVQEEASPALTGAAALTGRVAGAGSVIETFAFHLTLLVFFVAAQVAQVPTRLVSSDNSWHYRLARDVLSGERIYWSAVDANRLFPDLVFSIAALLLPLGGDFSTWIYHYQAVHSLALYASLAALAACLSRNVGERRLFLLVAAPAMALFMIALPFWGFWLVVPGNHGAGLPVAFLCLAIVFSALRSDSVSGPGAAAFVLMVALVIASNRLLLGTFIMPLLLTLVVGFGLRWRERGTGQALPDRDGPVGAGTGTYAVLIAMTCVAGVSGILTWRILGDLGWHKLVAPGGMPSPTPSVDWLVQTLTKEASELQIASGTEAAWDVFIGLLLLVVAVAFGAVVLARALRAHGVTASQENQVMLAGFAALSALAAMAFTIIKTDDSGPWHYRYLAVSIGFAVAALSSMPLLLRRFRGPGWGFTGVAVVGLTGALVLIIVEAEQRPLPAHQREATYERSIADLTRLIGRHAGEGAKLRGYAEYWLANDISTRSSVLQIGSFDSLSPVFRFYNNNAAELCAEEHLFVLHSPKKNEPPMDRIVALLGEPASVEETRLAGHDTIAVLYYDPAILKTRVTRPARERAVDVFPSFKCGT